MTGTARWIQAARGQLVRLVVVTAVLAGLGLPLGLHCAHGTPAAMPMPMPTSMAAAMPMAHGAVATDAQQCPPPGAMTAAHDRVESADVGLPSPVCAAAGVPTAFAQADDGSSAFNGMDGLLATCLLLIAAVMVAVARLRPAGLRGILRMLQSALGGVMFRAVRPRAPSLAELCLLRT